MLHHRLSAARVSHAAVSHDMTNAFLSVDHHVMDLQTERVGHASDVPLLVQRYRMASSHATASDGALDYAPGSGA